MRKTWPMLSFLLALSPTPPAPAQTASTIPIETFGEVPFFNRPVLSPDGKRVAAEGLIDGKTVVLVTDVDGGKPRAVPTGKLAIDEMQWAGSDTLLIKVRMTIDWIDGDTVPMTRLVALDVASGQSRILDKKSQGVAAGDVLYVSPDGASILVASQDDIYSYPSVKRIDVATGKARTVEPERPDVWTWFADGAGVVRAAVAYTSDRWKIWYRERADAPLKRLRAASTSADSGAIDGLKFATGDQQGFVVTDTKTGRFGVYKFDFASGTIGDVVFEHPDVDVSGVITDRDDGQVLGISYTADRYKVEWLDPSMRSVQARIDKVFPNAENVVMSTSRDGNRVLLWSGSASNPGSYYLFDRAARKLAPLATPLQKLSQASHAEVTPVSYAARDGLTIHGYLTLPRGRSAADLPLIVMPHGGPHVRDAWDFDRDAQFLASRGYAVLQPNFRGSTGYGKAFVEKGYGQWGRSMQDDVDDGVDWLVKSGRVDAKRVCIMGASYGGYAAIWGAIRNPERYRCAVSLAGVTDIAAMLKYDRRAFSAPRYFRAWQKKVQGEGTDLSAVSPVAQAARLKVPLLIAHGEKDTNVPPKQARALLAALKDNPTPVEKVFYPEEGHGLDRREDRIDFYRRLEVFLAKYNPS